jgi:hypothetical protein
MVEATSRHLVALRGGCHYREVHLNNAKWDLLRSGRVIYVVQAAVE